MRSADYTRLAAQLPPIYQEDAASYAQVDAYLGLADELNHAVVERLEDLMLGLGPDATLRWPTALPLDAGRDALLGSYLATYDEVARWVGYTFPASWGTDVDGLVRRREMLARSARLWRRRGTPRGFLSWFALYFGLEPDVVELPYLLEHYQAPGAAITGEPYTATLFVPLTETFEPWGRREEATEFARRYAPAHVLMRVCFVDPATFAALGVLTATPTLPSSPSTTDLDTYLADLSTRQADLNQLLCSVVSVVNHGSAIHIYECIDQGEHKDRLDVGRLPTT
ncbi:hypothetical protein [Nocardioides conyzicola]|uniref:Uncharacterized protein n=1 Tax=Nocardioides conyzicola TaxID=1651781 RepID=A0ABP8XZW5_9ACTN